MKQSRKRSLEQRDSIKSQNDCCFVDLLLSSIFCIGEIDVYVVSAAQVPTLLNKIQHSDLAIIIYVIRQTLQNGLLRIAEYSRVRADDFSPWRQTWLVGGNVPHIHTLFALYILGYTI